MDNKQFPEQGEEEVIPEELTFSPVEPEPEAIEELPAAEDIPVEEVIPEAEEMPAEETAPEIEAAEEAPAEETTPEIEAEEAPAEEELPEPAESENPVSEDIPAEEALPAQEQPSFMDRIPDVEEDYPEEAPANATGADLLTDPEVGSEITPDEQAMNYHGMLGHDEEEPPFDLSILDDPEFNEILTESEQPQEEIDDAEYRDDGGEFDAMFNAPAEEEDIPAHSRPTRKGRPKRKKGEGLFGIPSILVTFVWLALIVAIGVTLGRMLWVCAADVLAFGREDKPVTITIYESDSMEDITEKLYNAGLIRYKSLFNLYASISDAEEDIDPGIYDLNTRYDYHALVNMMSASSTREVVRVTIPEGYTCRQIFELLEENKICTTVDLKAYAANGELEEYWFLENVARGDSNCLEGFLFPDTYDFYKNDSPKNILEKMLDNFNTRFSEEMRAQIDTLNANVTDGTYGIQEVVIVASLIEKETASASESPRIAGVIYNRLFRWGDTPAYLNIDASIIYAQDGDASHIDTGIDSPYNTYRNVGLTPTAIANPGLASLQAALNPESHDYYYYVLNPSTGVHQFSSTYEEHQGYVNQFASEAQ